MTSEFFLISYIRLDGNSFGGKILMAWCPSSHNSKILLVLHHVFADLVTLTHSYQEGKVEYLCPHKDEDPVVTNFKRGILSALQVSISDLTPGSMFVIDEVS